MGSSNGKSNLLQAVKANKESDIKNLFKKFPNLKQAFINAKNDHPALCMAAYWGNVAASKALIEEGEDVNYPEQREGSTAVMIAAKHNKKALVNFLIENNADLEVRNKLGLCALDYSIIHGNYDIAYIIANKMTNKEFKSLDDYIKLNFEMKVPRFNIPLFYQCLIDNIDPSQTPPLHLTPQSNKNFEGKIPDPDESWGDFFKRLARFELYKPPMVDKNSVPLEKKNSAYVKMQSKLLEMEYNTQIKLDDDKDKVDIESGIEMKDKHKVGSYNPIHKAKSTENQIHVGISDFESNRQMRHEIEVLDYKKEEEKEHQREEENNNNNNRP